jgi:hypothetical protein
MPAPEKQADTLEPWPGEITTELVKIVDPNVPVIFL